MVDEVSPALLSASATESADDGPIDVTICIANWNCRALLCDCLESLLDQPQGVRLEAIVVDNASTDGAAEMIADDFPEVVLICNVENVGFARANNQAAGRAGGRHLFFLNNDTVVPEGALARLVAFADAHPEVGMIGPRLRDGRGRPQISYRRRPTVAAMMHRTLLLGWTGLFRVHRTREVVYYPDVEIIHFGRVSSRDNLEFADAHLPAGHVRALRTAGASPTALWAYKLVVTCDAPLTCLARWGQYAWRRLFKGRRKATRSRNAARGMWAFLTRGMGQFWRA